MNIETVNELIQSLESAGELSIRGQKFLKLAKAFKQLAAENLALKAAVAEEIEVINRGGQRYCVKDGMSINPIYARGWNDHRANVTAVETPATDRIVAGIKADAIDEAAVELDRVDTVASTRVIGFKLREFSQQLREGADKC